MTDTTASLREKRSGPVRQVDCRKSITISVRNTDTIPYTGERKPCQEPESCKTIEATSSHQSPPIGQPANPSGSQLYCRRSLAGPVQPELRPGCEDPGGAHEEEHRHRGHQREHQHRRRQCRGQALPQDDARPGRLPGGVHSSRQFRPLLVHSSWRFTLLHRRRQLLLLRWSRAGGTTSLLEYQPRRPSLSEG